MNKHHECIQPFIALEIDANGDVYTCCPCFINEKKIGSIFDDNINSFNDIWHSQSACEIREKILKGDYSLCNLAICRQRHNEFNGFVEQEKTYTIKPEPPQYITLAYDKECNLQCITCRDEKIRNNKEKSEQLSKQMEKLLAPLLKEGCNTKIIALSGSGEAFYSTHSRQLIKKITSSNSTVNFNINTNGLLFNEENCKTLGLEKRINEVFVSLPALSEKTYNRIMIGSNLSVVKKNIEWMSKEVKKGNIQKVTINAVVSGLNYKEIPKLIDFAKKLEIYITFSKYDNWGTKLGENYRELAVWEAGNKNHKDFVKHLNKTQRKYDKCYFSPLFENLIKK